MTTDDVKTAANSRDNLTITSRKFNNAKRAQSNTEFVSNEAKLSKSGVKLTEEGKQAAIRNETSAQQSINRQLKKVTARNIASTAHKAGLQGAKYGGGVALAVSGVQNIGEVIEGWKSVGEAVVDTAVTGGAAAATGYAMSGGMTVAAHTISNTLSKSSSKVLQSVAAKSVPIVGTAVTGVLAAGKPIKDFCAGENSGGECVGEIAKNGADLAVTGGAMALGQALIPIPGVGMAVGAAVGSLVSGVLRSIFD